MLIFPNGLNDVCALMTYHYGCNCTITIFSLQIIPEDFVQLILHITNAYGIY